MLILGTEKKEINARKHSFQVYLEENVVFKLSKLQLPMTSLFHGKVGKHTARIQEGHFPTKNEYSPIVEINWVENSEVIILDVIYKIDWRLLVMHIVLLFLGTSLTISISNILPFLLTILISILRIINIWKLSKNNINSTSLKLDELLAHY